MNWVSGTVGIRGITIGCVANFDHSRVELYIDRGNKEENKEIFDYLYQRRADIEAAMGVSLNWYRYEDRRASTITYRLENVSIEREEDWTQMAKFHTYWSKRFYDVFVPILRQWSMQGGSR